MCQQNKLTPAEKEKIRKMIDMLKRAKKLFESSGDPFLTVLAGYRISEAIENVDEVIDYLNGLKTETNEKKESDYPDLSGPEIS